MMDTYTKHEEGDEEEDMKQVEREIEIERGGEEGQRQRDEGQGKEGRVGIQGEEGEGRERGRTEGFQDALSKVHQLESEKEAITTIEFVYGRNPNLFKCWIPILGILFVVMTFLSLLFLVTLPELRAVQRQRETTCLILEFRSASIYQATINRQDKLVLTEELLVRYNVLSDDSSSSSSERHKYKREHLRFHSLRNTFKNDDDSSSLTSTITTPSCSFPRKMCNSDFIEDCTSPFLSQQLMSYCFGSKYNSAQNVTCYYEQDTPEEVYFQENKKHSARPWLLTLIVPFILLSLLVLFELAVFVQVNSDAYHSPLEESEDPEVSDEYLEELSRNAEREVLERAGFGTGSDNSGDVEMQTISSALPYSSSSPSLSPSASSSSSTRLFSSSSSSPLVTRREGEDIEMETQSEQSTEAIRLPKPNKSSSRRSRISQLPLASSVELFARNPSTGEQTSSTLTVSEIRQGFGFR